MNELFGIVIAGAGVSASFWDKLEQGLQIFGLLMGGIASALVVLSMLRKEFPEYLPAKLRRKNPAPPAQPPVPLE